jgi:hypothetical protein
MQSYANIESELVFCVLLEKDFDIPRVADPHHFNADPDPAFHFNADPDPAFHFNVYPDPAFLLDADLDPALHFNADPDPFTSMRIRNRILLLIKVTCLWTLQGSILSLQTSI